MTFQVQDKLLIQTAALSNGAGATQITGFDLGHNAARLGRNLADFELKIDAPALTTTLLPDAETMTYSIEHATDAAFTSPVVLHANVLQQLGAGGAGAAAASKRVRLPTDVLRFVRVKATKTGTGNASTVSMTVAMNH